MEAVHEAAAQIVETVETLTATLNECADKVCDTLRDGGNSASDIETLTAEVQMLRKVLKEVERQLDPLHHLGKIADMVEKLARGY